MNNYNNNITLRNNNYIVSEKKNKIVKIDLINGRNRIQALP